MVRNLISSLFFFCLYGRLSVVGCRLSVGRLVGWTVISHKRICRPWMKYILLACDAVLKYHELKCGYKLIPFLNVLSHC
jgi:hypothetical protein